MATLPQFKQRQIARRSTSDIDRLGKQYQSSIAGITGEYETAFSKYSIDVTEKQKPFEAAKKLYDEKYGSYLTNLTQYNTSSADYQKSMDSYLKKVDAAQEILVTEDPSPPQSSISYFTINGKKINVLDLKNDPQKYGFEYAITPFDAGRKGTRTWTLKPLVEGAAPVAPTNPGAFTEKPPEAPVVPEFDSNQFAAKKTEAENTFKREVDERRAAKLGAVSRKGSRPLLSGAQA